MEHSNSPPQPLLDSQALLFAVARRRAVIACSNCRKRKVRCVTSEKPPQNPCERCTRRRLACQYVTVAEDIGNNPAGDVPVPPEDHDLERQGYNSQASWTTWEQSSVDPNYSSELRRDDLAPHSSDISTSTLPSNHVPGYQHAPYRDDPWGLPHIYSSPPTWQNAPGTHPSHYSAIDMQAPMEPLAHNYASAARHSRGNGQSILYQNVPAMDHLNPDYTHRPLDEMGNPMSFYRYSRA
ncbi:hypothetical protein C8J57DRAFT_1470985 [Mycena rebaudengoi]|nr:hypothetical protein C8J57DRAFT_1470985 [Mycena rebaudengoi]